MANSIDVVAGNDAKASEYNNLRKDVLDLSTGHNHDGTNSRDLADDSVKASKMSPDASYSEAITRYYSVSPADGIPDNDARKFTLEPGQAKSSDTTSTNLSFPIHLPHNSIVKKITMYYYRNDASASISAGFYKTDFQSNGTDLKDMNSNSSAGYHSVVGSSIDETIDNTAYTYCLFMVISPNDASTDAKFCGAVIEFTVVKPLP